MNPVAFHHEGHEEHKVPWSHSHPLLFVLLVLLVVNLPADGAEPFLKKGDVIALVGGEDMVVAGELGYLELLLTRALPEHRLRFRSLAWEGDTVFEQRRDLHFPPLEAQLDQVGATVVICQFGQMESLMGKEKLPEFIAAYKKLIERINPHGKRWILPMIPWTYGEGAFASDWVRRHSPVAGAYNAAIAWEIGTKGNVVNASDPGIGFAGDPQFPGSGPPKPVGFTRDGWHLSELGHRVVAYHIANDFIGKNPWDPSNSDGFAKRVEAACGQSPDLLTLIRAKNRLWFDYWRVQNWAFLAGDRTEQPSSRDHLDRSKRWFPAEREAFLPLIEAKEREIDTLAVQLAARP